MILHQCVMSGGFLKVVAAKTTLIDASYDNALKSIDLSGIWMNLVTMHIFVIMQWPFGKY